MGSFQYMHKNGGSRAGVVFLTCAVVGGVLAFHINLISYKNLPMVKISLESNREIEITKDIVLDHETFELVGKALNHHSLEDILDVSYSIRSNYAQAKCLLDMAEKRCSSELQQENVDIQKAGLMIQHKLDVKPLLEKLQSSDDKRVDFLRGVFLLNMNQIEDAEFCFEKIGYKNGLERCAVMKKDTKEMSISNDPIVKCYFSSKNWSKFDASVDNNNFLYIIGKSDVFDDKENVDIKIKHIEQEIDSSTDAMILNGLIDKLNALICEGVSSPQILYDIGKIYHILENYESAAQWYEKALSLDIDYLPAKFNLSRIKNELVECKHKCTAIRDFNAIVSLKNLVFDVDLNDCSDFVRKLCWIIIQARNMNKSAIPEMKSISKYIDHVALENNKAILMDNDTSIEIFQNLMKNIDFNRLEFVKYNLGVSKRDVKLLEECSLPEAHLYCDYLKNNISTSDIKLRAYLTGDKSLVHDMNDPFCVIFVGNKLLDEFTGSHCLDTSLLDKAEAVFRSSTSSPLCINGLGICAVFKNNITVAIKLFNQITSEFSGAFKNLGFCYLLQKNYAKAVDCFLQMSSVKLSKSDEKALLCLVEKTKDLRMIDFLIEKGLDRLKKTKALILLERGDIKKAVDLKVEDSEVLEKIDELRK
ncbi:uncharacterized protein VICG_01451 [Vittaforma corneae ATCC 50505]|uniref:Uncharacterized protein n=1 Tax=Vittaforma corneae (strain ATCC 50505) TaxID=993615 RepID=L2GME8_VITCO|nr:uncharacterized protein VICG_01451 [Vittaforma corneae ATCC 50505]ELA41467.1 hypothetical protein VICG_01451 [Vittaforma corneae ATCC 50505]